MIFKRKQARPADVGTICVIKNDVKDSMKDSWMYKSKSATFHSNGRPIRQSSLRKKSGLTAMLADATLVYIIEEFIFDGLVKVIPVSIENDNFSAAGLMSLIKAKKSFLIKKDSLSSTSQDFIERDLEKYSRNIKNYISAQVSNNYKIPFSWENK